MRYIYNSHAKVTIILLLGILPSLVFFWSVTEGMYRLAFVAFLISSADFAHRYLNKFPISFTSIEEFLDFVVRRLSEALFVTSFGFAGLARWPLVIAILVSVTSLTYMRVRFLTIPKNSNSIQMSEFEHLSRFIIVVTAFAMFFFFPNVSFYGLSLSEITLTILFGHSIVYFVRDFYKHSKSAQAAHQTPPSHNPHTMI